jgi:hypothetical protein
VLDLYHEARKEGGTPSDERGPNEATVTIRGGRLGESLEFVRLELLREGFFPKSIQYCVVLVVGVLLLVCASEARWLRRGVLWSRVSLFDRAEEVAKKQGVQWIYSRM